MTTIRTEPPRAPEDGIDKVWAQLDALKILIKVQCPARMLDGKVIFRGEE